MRRIIGFGLAAVLAVIVAGAIYLGVTGRGAPGISAGKTTTVKAVIGSEKKPFFEDEQVKKRFAELGYTVLVDTAGSREIAQQDLSGYDLAFPASAPAAEHIKRTKKEAKKTFTPFYSPMIVATWEPIVELLKPAGVVTENNGRLDFNVQKYLELVKTDTRWTSLPNNTAYPANKLVLVSTTDVRRSNSAAMYQAVTSYVANGNQVVSNTGQVDAVINDVTKTFLAQGYVENTSSGPFGNYLSLGMGQVPMVWAYESQFLGRQIANDGSISDNMRVLYPSPSINSSHTVVSLSDTGTTIGELLSQDEELAKHAARYGFRPTKPGVFQKALQEANVPVPPQMVNVIDPPAAEMAEEMISRIEKQYSSGQPPQESTDG